VVVVSRPKFGLWGGLVFWFGLFFGCRWDGWRRLFVRVLCWLYVGWGGMRMGGHVVFVYVWWFTAALKS
jgi:hypothetical protein